MSKLSDEQEPCPRCGKMHMRGEYRDQPSRREPGKGMPQAPDDVTCGCGATLREIVPIFRVNSSGWQWKIL